MSALEARYRRLLAVYPAAHRQEYGDEMVGVLMSGARPGQRFPGFRDALDLVRSGLLTRVLGGGAPGRPAPGRRDAAVVAALLTTLALMVGALRHMIWMQSWMPSQGEIRYTHTSSYTGSDFYLRALVWLLVAIALMLGWRRVAVALGVLSGLTEIAVLAMNEGDPFRWVTMGAMLVTLPVVLALLIYAIGGRRPAQILGRRGVALLTSGVVLAGMSGGPSLLVPWQRFWTVSAVVMLGAGVFLLFRGLWRADAEVRPPLVVLLAGLAAIVVAQPIMEDAVDLVARNQVTSYVYGMAAAFLLGLPVVGTLLATAFLAATRSGRYEEPDDDTDSVPE